MTLGASTAIAPTGELLLLSAMEIEEPIVAAAAAAPGDEPAADGGAAEVAVEGRAICLNRSTMTDNPP